MLKRFTKLEKSWILYDIGNSAFTMMVSTLIPIWYNSLSAQAGLKEASYLATWSFATSIATLLTALLGPITGSIADNKGFKKPMFMFALFGGAFGCALLGIAPHYILFLIIYVIAKVLYQLSLVYYDSMINDITTQEKMDDVSSIGYAWGYIGSCIPFLVALVVYFLGTKNIVPMKLAIMFDFFLIAAWWIAVTIPLLKNYEQIHYVSTTSDKIKEGFHRIFKTLTRMYRDEKKVFYFLIGFFFYIDGVYTIIDEAVAIGKSMGLPDIGLLMVLLFTQVVAFFFASLFGRLSRKYPSTKLITVCIVGYACVAFYALIMKTLWQFGILAFGVGMFQGAIQALSRSYYGQIIPPDSSGEYFGIYDICGKGAAFLGTTMVGGTIYITNSVNIAVATLAILFVIGLFFFRKSAKLEVTK